MVFTQLREEYLNTLEQEERAALVAAALKSEEEHSDKLRLQAEAQWDDLSDEQRAKYEVKHVFNSSHYSVNQRHES